MATITSAGSGGSSSGSTWTGGVKPGASDDVVVQTGHAVAVDEDTAWHGLTTQGTGTVSVADSCRLTLPPGSVVSLAPSTTLTVGYRGEFFQGTDGGARCTLTTTGGSAGAPTNARVVGTGGGGGCGGGRLYNVDVSFLGYDNDNRRAWHANVVDGDDATGRGWTFVAKGCVFDGCGAVYLPGAEAKSRISITGCDWKNTPAGVQCVKVEGSSGTLTGTRLIDSCVFDRAPSFAPATLWTLDNSILSRGLNGASATGPWASFDNNLLRMTGDGQATPQGSVTGSFLWYDAPAGSNPHFLEWPAIPAAPSQAVTGNAFYFNGTAGDGNVMLFDISNAATGQAVRIAFNLFLANAAGNTSGALTTTSDLANPYVLTIEHNTYNVAHQWGLEIGHGPQTVADDRFASVRANLFYGVDASNSFKACAPDTGIGQAVPTDIISPSVIGHNAGYKVTPTSATHPELLANQGNGYVSAFSSVPGGTDVSLDASGGPQFVDPTATLLSWARSVDGTVTTEADVLSRFQSRASGFTVAALLAYLRAAYRPQNALLADATYPGDAATEDAAGNPLGGTIGAMAYLAPAPASGGGGAVMMVF